MGSAEYTCRKMSHSTLDNLAHTLLALEGMQSRWKGLAGMGGYVLFPQRKRKEEIAKTIATLAGIFNSLTLK